MNVKEKRTTNGKPTAFITRTNYLNLFSFNNQMTSLKLTIDNEALIQYQQADQMLAQVQANIRKLEEINLEIERLGPRLLEQSKTNKAETEMIKQHLAEARTPTTQLHEFREKFNNILKEATIAFNNSLVNINKAPDLLQSTAAELKRQKMHLEKIKNLAQTLAPIQDQMAVVQKALMQFDKSTPLAPRTGVMPEALTPK